MNPDTITRRDCFSKHYDMNSWSCLQCNQARACELAQTGSCRFSSWDASTNRNERERLDELVKAAQEFVTRCEKGEIRSSYTYSKMKGILQALGADE